MQEFKENLYNRCGSWSSVLREQELDAEFDKCLSAIWNLQIIHPAKEDVLKALEFTKLEEACVVILGQDPYTTPGTANGLAFATNFNKQLIPPSLVNVYKALQMGGLIGARNAIETVGLPAELEKLGAPTHGDLSPWATRGVLLLNTQLTSGSTPGDHDFWIKYVDALIKRISAARPNLTWFMWGKKALAKASLLARGSEVVSCVHPSPQAGTSFPSAAAPKFRALTARYGIDWDPYFYDPYYVATDGSCLGNGKKTAVGGIGIYFPADLFGVTNTIEGKFAAHLPAPCTNNVAEMRAGMDALARILLSPLEPMHKRKIVLVTDSEYFYNTIVKGWIWKPDDTYKNVELRVELRKLLTVVLQQGKLLMRHVNSHLSQTAIEKMDEPERSFHRMNEVADELASTAARTT